MTGLRGALMVCGTTSDAGKSTVVTGLCRLLARRGVRVAPFKAQNMALNSAVTASGHEIGRAQAAQAEAAGVAPEVAMNPILLKPESDRTSQVVVMGRPWATLDAAAYHRAKPQLRTLVADQLADLRRRFDVVICEGAGSPAEINLLDADIVNLAVARDAAIPALVVGDIDRGGVFAALYGTVELLPPDLRRLVRGFVINKFRGDPGLLGAGPAELERRTGVPTLGVLPWLADAEGDAEDSLALARFGRSATPGGRALDVAVVRFPRISNFTDLDPLVAEPGVHVRLVETEAALGVPDLVVLPGSKSTVADLAWLRATGLARAITGLAGPGRPMTVLGICGGYQMLGTTIGDRGVETPGPTTVDGLGLLAARTEFRADKVTRLRSGHALGQPVHGYQIHHGRTVGRDPWVDLSDPAGAGAGDGDGAHGAHAHGDDGNRGGPEGDRAGDGAVAGTSLHGLFESDRFRETFLAGVAGRAGRPWAPGRVRFAERRQARIDRLADALEAHLDLPAIDRLIADGGIPDNLTADGRKGTRP